MHKNEIHGFGQKLAVKVTFLIASALQARVYLSMKRNNREYCTFMWNLIPIPDARFDFDFDSGIYSASGNVLLLDRRESNLVLSSIQLISKVARERIHLRHFFGKNEVTFRATKYKEVLCQEETKLLSEERNTNKASNGEKTKFGTTHGTANVCIFDACAWNERIWIEIRCQRYNFYRFPALYWHARTNVVNRSEYHIFIWPLIPIANTLLTS